MTTPTPRRGEPREEIDVARTPQGERRGRDHRVPTRSTTSCRPRRCSCAGERSDPDTRDREAIGRALLETLASFGVDAEIVGTVIGPHVSRYELRLAPGTKVAKAATPGRPRVRARFDGHPHPRADPRQAGDRRRGPEPAPAAGSPRRHLQGRPSGSSPIVGWLGKDIAGHAVWTDLAKMPHVLVAGTGLGEVPVASTRSSRRCYTRRRTRSASCSSTQAGRAEPLRAGSTC